MTLWTPGGEVPIERNQPSQPSEPAPSPSGRPGTPRPADEGAAGYVGGPSLEDLSPEERAQAEQMISEMAEVQRQILATPAAQIVTNHIVGFYELAAIHLGQDRPDFVQAQLAIDAMAAALDAVESRIGSDGASLRQALTQLQMAFVQRRSDLGED